MGTRHVWDRYSTVDVPSGTYEEKKVDAVIGSYSTTRIKGQPTDHWVGCTAKPTGPDSYGCYTPAGTTFTSGSYGGADAIIQSSYHYFMVIDCTENRRQYFYNVGSYSAQWYVDRRYSTDVDGFVSLEGISNQQKYAINIVKAVEGTVKGPGTIQGQSASPSSTAYPNDGLSGSYWYKYKGSDNIDPTGITYSNDTPKGGDTVTVTVTPRSNTYGGTIYYQYAYSTDGGASWTNSGSKTTDTTQSFSIAKGATQFQVRVVASDNFDYVSTTYVSGANLPVTNLHAYLGVNRKARRVGKLYLGVNGKARKVVKGYVGDANGKAKLWL